jgi:RNase P protein component
MREAVRLSVQACDGPVDIVFHPRKSVGNVPFAELVSEVTRALRLAAQRARTGEAK